MFQYNTRYSSLRLDMVQEDVHALTIQLPFKVHGYTLPYSTIPQTISHINSDKSNVRIIVVIVIILITKQIL
jgi:hypothetical protein